MRATELRALVHKQDGMLSRQQALSAGYTPKHIEWQLSKGQWRRVLFGIYATFSGSLTTMQKLVAATLYGGVGAQITGAAALHWHGLQYAPPERLVQVLVPACRRRKSSGFVVLTRTTRRDPRAERQQAIEVCSVARALADTARRSSHQRTVRAFMAEAVQSRLTTVAELFEELARGPKNGSGLFRAVLTELGEGVRSAPEAEFRAVLGASCILPKILWNPELIAPGQLRLPSPDGWIDEVALALEVDSKQHHSLPDGWKRTLERQRVLATYGVQTVGFTPQEIRDDPQAVLRRVEAIYLERKAAGIRRSAVRAIPTSVRR